MLSVYGMRVFILKIKNDEMIEVNNFVFLLVKYFFIKMFII